MKKKGILFAILIILVSIPVVSFANPPDSAYIFSYSTAKNNFKNGLHYAWSIDKKSWLGIGPEFQFLFSDYGNWGSQKKLIAPFLLADNNGAWHCLWSLNNEVGQFAHASSSDLYTWKPQSYPEVMKQGNVMETEVHFDKAAGQYVITWLSDVNGTIGIYKTYTEDFETYSKTTEGNTGDRFNCRHEVAIDGHKQQGTIIRVSWEVVDALIKYYEWSQYHEMLRNENMDNDAELFNSLDPLEAKISVYPSESKEISKMLIGIFFEDINYAADGGLYAELVQNRGFEYTPADTKFRDQSWNSLKAWKISGNNVVLTIDTINPIHPNQKHYVIVDLEEQGAGLVNEGYDGIPVRTGEMYDFSIFAKILGGSGGKLQIRLVDDSGTVIGTGQTRSIGNRWKKYETTITANETVEKATLEVVPLMTGRVALDMISLFPRNTFMGHRNGLRADLAQTIASIKPGFVRFPGGCVAHGDGLGNIYRWKYTVGPLETRKTQPNIWRYHQSAGLGYFEYFQFCEDIGAEPIPVLAAGVPCQNSSTGGNGQQGGIPMCDMDDYVQEVLDLIEWANGDKHSTWGKVRAEAGHPESFNLKYIGIGNEDLITTVFEERYKMIINAVRENYPEITVIGTVGPFYTGSDYERGWELATEMNLPMVDEHYYQPPGWFWNNQDFYDRYDRSKSKVYLGEYATHIGGRRLNIETALTEALYLIAIERNGDVVHMTSYAPLLGKYGHTQWNPDLIYFNNTEIFPTVDYYVQKLYGENSGDEYIPSFIRLSSNDRDVQKRVAMSIVKNNSSGDIIFKLVNLLPVEISSVINMENMIDRNSEAVLTVLKGEPDDNHARPVQSSIPVSSQLIYTIPAYSFSIIRIPGRD